MAPTTLRASFWPPWPSIRLGPGHVYGSLFNAFCESEISGRGTASEGSKSLPGIEEVAPLACPTLISRLRLRKLLIALECVDTNKRQATQSLEVIAAAAEMRGCGADSNGGGASPKTEEGSFLAVVSNIQFQIWALRLKETVCKITFEGATANMWIGCRSALCITAWRMRVFSSAGVGFAERRVIQPPLTVLAPPAAATASRQPCEIALQGLTHILNAQRQCITTLPLPKRLRLTSCLPLVGRQHFLDSTS